MKTRLLLFPVVLVHQIRKWRQWKRMVLRMIRQQSRMLTAKWQRTIQFVFNNWNRKLKIWWGQRIMDIRVIYHSLLALLSHLSLFQASGSLVAMIAHSAVQSSTQIITNKDCTFGCQIIHRDTIHNALFFHWHLQERLIQPKPLTNWYTILGDNS